MIIEFKTKRNEYGHRDYLKIDTDDKTYTRQPHFIAEGAEIKKTDMRELIEKRRADGYKQI